jgi:hypothetical protein
MIPEHITSALVPVVIEQSNRGERSFDIYSRLLRECTKPLEKIESAMDRDLPRSGIRSTAPSAARASTRCAS